MDKAVVPIAEFVARDDFPQGAVGAVVDIGGYVGTVVEIVHNSIRVRTPEGVTRGFNFYTLRKLYGPRPDPVPEPKWIESNPLPRVSRAPAESIASAEPPEPPEIENPDFNQELKPISELIAQKNFPAGALGRFVEVNGYTGVVVQILNQSLKIRSREGTSRRYNAETLRKLHSPK
jgi:uncharacterized protein (DUF3820 family)